MYGILRIVLPIICIVGIIYMMLMKNKYKNDTSSSKEDIINYFKEQHATSVENGIKAKDLPTFIAKSPYLLMMVKDKTLIFEKGNYYLNSSK